MTDFAAYTLQWKLDLMRQASGLTPEYWDIPAMRAEDV